MPAARVMHTYPDWLICQTPERQLASIEHLIACRDLGMAQRTGDWVLADKLSEKVMAYYKKWGE
jgi:hypothetical protein